MKLAYTIAALAFAGAIGGLGMTGTADAHPVPQGRYCLHNPYGAGSENCGYMNLQQCVINAQPMGGSCTVNRNIAYRAEPYGYGYGYGMARRH